jgi:hypothetical protein
VDHGLGDIEASSSLARAAAENLRYCGSSPAQSTDSGTVTLDGETIDFREEKLRGTPPAQRGLQSFNLFPHLSVASVTLPLERCTDAPLLSRGNCARNAAPFNSTNTRTSGRRN